MEFSHFLSFTHLTSHRSCLQFEPRAEGHVARGQAEHHRGHQTTSDGSDALQKLHDLAGGEPGQQGEESAATPQSVRRRC